MRVGHAEMNEGRQVKRDIQRARHHQPTGRQRHVKTGGHQPDWETNEGRQVKADPESRTPSAQRDK